MLSIKEAFDGLFEGIEIDKKLADKVYKWHIKYLNKNREQLEFFAGNLIGVQVVRFTVADIQSFYRDVLGLDMLNVESISRTITTIDQTRKVSSDPMNLCLMYLIHRFVTSTKLNEKDRKRAAYDTALVFFYRCLVIRQSEWFHFPADPKIAQAAYAKLSNKFLLKQLGSWKAVMDYRAKEFIREDTKDQDENNHLANLIVFENDERITYAISDGEGRIRSMYKNYYFEFNKAVVSKDSIVSSSATIVDIEGIEKLKDKTRSVEKAIGLMQNIVHDQKSFNKPELVKAIIDINSNTSGRMLSQVLDWVSLNYTDVAMHKKIDEFIRLTVTHSYHLVNEMGEGELTDLATVMVTLKNLYLSTRSSDPELLKVRKLGSEIVKRSAGKVNNSLEMATRSALILYITLRAFVAVK